MKVTKNITTLPDVSILEMVLVKYHKPQDTHSGAYSNIL